MCGVAIFLLLPRVAVPTDYPLYGQFGVEIGQAIRHHFQQRGIFGIAPDSLHM